MPRYALLRHEVPADFGRPSHWDLLIEQADDCAAWAMEALPAALGGAGDSVPAILLAPHRKKYLDYSGPVSGERGTVQQVLGGVCTVQHQSADSWQLLLTTPARIVTLAIELRHGAWQLLAH